ncbi:MAG TPA: TraR/DksA C4-type zinc finger protein [Candidatus Hydrogenedentes bacterium]|nr:TraR/DksA C4-type zinc finger protein [Candidatus Hydrogenedentota bacterium]HPC17592.1 TraR/DksA C4-type zinc finger protein [Candidatus Hydrogenedentota bacterium]HRT21477.1 TraR/DksA C4-type zinc finger protein [Candidatus Hydrogenedentota bacterium]HRT63919.1 TraR/DksA C4-type zinc finger protein [Candidatus Hydrogenedentota bacterium]
MNKKEAKKFEKLLLDDLGRLSEGIRKIEESALHESVRETTGDLYSYAETGTDNFERETALNIATGESERLRDVTDALKRIANGTYGVCEGCEEQIPKKRLEVFPAARYCIKCKSKLEKEGTL